jgi:SAM-dependent methyltransferase
MLPHNPADLSRIYGRRFETNLAYRAAVWKILVKEFFQKMIPASSHILDLGCGYGEFINQVTADRKAAMDLNPDAPKFLDADVRFIHQDCSTEWAVKSQSLDMVFTSNFFEHLPNKASLGRTLDQIGRCLRHGGRLIAMGPNIKHLPGSYWDFWDHYLPLTELSLREALENRSFVVETCIDRFLPYTMAGKKPLPLPLIALYLRAPFAWKILGRQFLVVASACNP